MADQVTISTFLELRDNLSGGVKKVTAQLDEMRQAANAANAALERMSRINRMAAASQTAGMTAVTRSANTATQAAKAVGGGFGSTLVKVDGVIDAVSALRYAVTGFIGVQAVKSVVKLNEEFENLRFRIAGTIMASKLASNIDIAEKKSERVLGTLRMMAAKLPGEAQEYAGAFAMALPKLLASGMTNLTKAADFVSRYTAVAISNGVDAAQAGRDLMLMLSGRAGMQVKTFTVLSEKIGMTAKDFNRLNAEVRRQKVEEALKPYEGLLAKVSEGFTAKFGELKTTFSDIIRLGSAPLFAGAKSSLAVINDWLLRNKTMLIETGKVISRDIMSALRVVGSLASKLGENFDSIWSTTRMIFELWASAKLVGAIGSLIRVFSTLRSVIFGVRVQSQLAAMASARISPGGAAAGALGVATTAASATPWGRIAATVLQGAAFLGMEMSARSAEKEAAAKERKAEFEPSLKFGELFKKQTGGRYFGAAPELQIAKELFEFRKRFKVTAAVGTEELFEEVVKRQKDIKAAGLAELASPEIMRAYGELKGFDYELAKMKADGTFEPPSVPTAPGVRTPVANYDFRGSRFDIKQEFAEGFDPDRIATAFATDLSLLGELKLQAAFGHIGMVR